MWGCDASGEKEPEKLVVVSGVRRESGFRKQWHAFLGVKPEALPAKKGREEEGQRVHLNTRGRILLESGGIGKVPGVEDV